MGVPYRLPDANMAVPINPPTAPKIKLNLRTIAEVYHCFAKPQAVN
jgi:hypothetical protein